MPQPQAVGNFAVDFVRQAERARARQRSLPEDTPDESPPRRTTKKRHACHTRLSFPLSLLSKRSAEMCLCFALVHKVKNTRCEKIPDSIREDTTVDTLLQKFQLTFDPDDVYRIAADAEAAATDFERQHEQKRAWVNVHQGVLTDAYRGDMTLLHFLVLSAVMSCIGQQAKPRKVTVAQITRRMHGFTTRRTSALSSESFHLSPDYHQIRRITVKLAQHGFFQRATVGLWTWYATKRQLRACRITDLKLWAINVAIRNKKRALKDHSAQVEALEEYERQKQQVDNQLAALRAQKKTLRKKRPTVQQDAPSTIDVAQLQLDLQVRLYADHQLTPAHRQAVRCRVKLPDGQTYFSLQDIDHDTRLVMQGRGVVVF